MKIEFNPEEKRELVRRLQSYFELELDQELGQFETEFLLDFISETMGPFYYNQDIYDAQALLQEQLEQVGDAIFQLEKTPPKAKH